MCEKAVRVAVKEVGGVKEVRVDRNAERVSVDCQPGVSVEALAAAIESAGFRAEFIDE